MNVKEKIVQVLSLNVVLWLAMLIVFTGVVFCAYGIYTLLIAPVGPTWAAIITGAGLIGLVVALALAVVIASTAGQKSKAKQVRNNPDNLLEHQLRPMIGDRATEWAKQHTGIAVVGALSAGVLLTASPRLRSLLVGATGPLLTRKAIKALQDLSDN